MTKSVIKPEPPKAGYIHKRINRSPVNVDSIEAITPETDRMVTGTFSNIECPGQPAKICAKLYRDMEYFAQTFEDGQNYTIPLSVARWINERCFFTQNTHLLDEKGQPIKGTKKIPRYKFSANF